MEMLKIPITLPLEPHIPNRQCLIDHLPQGLDRESVDLTPVHLQGIERARKAIPVRGQVGLGLWAIQEVPLAAVAHCPPARRRLVRERAGRHGVRGARPAVGLARILALGLAHVPTIQDLWEAPYGRVLVGKILLAGVVLFVGFVNWRRGLPVLDSHTGLRSVRRRAAFEVGLAGVVLGFAATLTGMTSP